VSRVLPSLPKVVEQAERLIELGVHDLGGLAAGELRAWAAAVETEDALLVVRSDRLPASKIASLMTHQGHAGFVVSDMEDVDQFTDLDPVAVPSSKVYLVHGLDRGDGMANWSPDEALPAITADGRSPLTLVEGIHWVLQEPEALERNHCFMTIGSRLRKPGGKLDARTPAIWISNGTGRDGRSRRHAPKVGWCWAGNRHSWLGFASAADRSALASS
jgi:hypothetical protein